MQTPKLKNFIFGASAAAVLVPFGAFTANAAAKIHPCPITGYSVPSLPGHSTAS